MLDIDMNGASGSNTVQVQLYTDYVSSSPVKTFGLPSNTNGRQWVSLVPDSQTDGTFNRASGYGQKAQVIYLSFILNGGPQRPIIYGMRITYRPVGEITAGPVYDWNDLGYLWDKRLTEFTVTYDTNTTAQTLLLDTITGINGNTVNLDAASFAIQNVSTVGPSRALQNFALPDGIIVKMIRLRALTTNSTAIGSTFFRILNTDFQYTKFPPDVTAFTEPNDFGYPCEKIARNLIVKMDTGGVGATVYLLGDGNIVGSYTVSTVLDDWTRIIPVASNPDVIARLYKLQIVAGSSGKAQLFDWSLDFVKEPCAVSKIDTFETDFGFNGWKYIYEGWFDYQANSSVTVNILKDSSVLFYSGSLPAHASRDMERFFLPMVVGSTYNKSKKYRVQVFGSGSTLKLYSNSRFDWMPWNGDQRASFNGFSVSPEQQLPTG